MPKPAIYVPGLPASHLHDRQSEKKLFLNIPAFLSPSRRREVLRLLRGPDDLIQGDNVVAGIPIRRAAKVLFFDIAKQADSLYDILEKVGVRPARFGWDWRRPVWDAPMLDKLRQDIERLHQMSGQRVVVIAHSTGGLVVRRLLEEHGNDFDFLDRIERVVAFGVPWAGTLKSLEFLAGEKDFGLGLVSRGQAQTLLAHSWAAFDLLPPDPATTDLTDAAGRPLAMVVDDGGRQVSPLVERGWYRPELRGAMELRAAAADRELGRRAPSFDLPARTVPVTNIVGWGTETTTHARISGAGAAQTVEFTATQDGDATVPRVSAAWLRGPGVHTYHVPVGIVPGATQHAHSVLWRNPGGRNLLRHLVGDKRLLPFLYGAVDERTFRDGDSVRVRLVALDDAGAPLQGARVRTTDLVGGEVADDFDPGGEGRHLIRIPRQSIRDVGGNLGRFTLEISGRDGGRKIKQRRSFFIWL